MANVSKPIFVSVHIYYALHFREVTGQPRRLFFVRSVEDEKSCLRYNRSALSASCCALARRIACRSVSMRLAPLRCSLNVWILDSTCMVCLISDVFVLLEIRFIEFSSSCRGRRIMPFPRPASRQHVVPFASPICNQSLVSCSSIPRQPLSESSNIFKYIRHWSWNDRAHPESNKETRNSEFDSNGNLNVDYVLSQYTVNLLSESFFIM